MKKVLIVTYYWPPSGGAGVQRWLKFSKYLPDSGWEPVVLTVDPLYAAYPQKDESLAADVPTSLRVIRTRSTDYFAFYKKDRTRIPSAGFASGSDNSFRGKIIRFVRGNFFLPDPRRGWNSHAYRKACSLIEKEDIANIITTSPPHSTQLVGLKLKRKFPRVNWIADLRDPWTDIYYYHHFYPTPLSRSIDAFYERSVLRNADAIVTVGPSLKEHFIARLPEAVRKINIITNGFDPSDFESAAIEVSGRFTIAYVGTLSDQYPIDGLADALATLAAKGREFVFSFAGSISEEQRSILEKLPPAYLSFKPYLPHNEATSMMCSSSMLLLIIPVHSTSRSIITGKLFEYLGSGKPVLCLGPADGDAAEIIRESGAGLSAEYNDSNTIAQFMESVMEGSFKRIESGSLKYTRKVLAGRLATLLK